jgi:hypothetical protein
MAQTKPYSNPGTGNIAVRYKSQGERKIADVLSRYSLDFIYEPGLLVYDRDLHQPRIWYPDFGLPRYGVYIEYFGREGDPQYDARVHHKLKTYHHQQIAVVPVYPNDLRGDYERKIIDPIHQYTAGRLRDLEHRISRAPRRQHGTGLYRPRARY